MVIPKKWGTKFVIIFVKEEKEEKWVYLPHTPLGQVTHSHRSSRLLYFDVCIKPTSASQIHRNLKDSYTTDSLFGLLLCKAEAEGCRRWSIWFRWRSLRPPLMEGLRLDLFTEVFSLRMGFRFPLKDWIAVGIYFGVFSSLSTLLLWKTATRFCILCSVLVFSCGRKLSGNGFLFYWYR